MSAARVSSVRGRNQVGHSAFDVAPGSEGLKLHLVQSGTNIPLS
jgi:hypothetical protein